MRELTLSQKSGFFSGLMWRLATEFGQMDKWENHYDICQVIRYSLQGLMMCLIIVWVSVLVSIPVIQMIVWVSFMAVNKIFMEPNSMFIVSWVITITLSIFAGLIFTCVEVIEFVRNADRGRAKEGLALSIYRSIKNKTCVKVKFK